MAYFAQFWPDGTRITSYVEGVHDSIPPDAIQISDADQALYAGGGYIRDMVKGVPVPYVASDADKAAILRASVIARIKELEAGQHGVVREAILSGDNSKLQAIHTEIMALQASISVPE